jgi:IclR family pca regulon transcriptional regulator
LGKQLLVQPDPEVTQIMSAYHNVDFLELKKELKRIRQQGWALSEQQFDLSFRGIAVPLRDSKRDLLGALSVLMPIQGQPSDEVVNRVVPVLQEAAQSLQNLI